MLETPDSVGAKESTETGLLPLHEVSWLLIGSTDRYDSLKKDISRVCSDVVGAACIDEICVNDIVQTFIKHGYRVSPISTPTLTPREQKFVDSMEGLMKDVDLAFDEIVTLVNERGYKPWHDRLRKILNELYEPIKERADYYESQLVDIERELISRIDRALSVPIISMASPEVHDHCEKTKQ